jgi:hypothetical protein
MSSFSQPNLEMIAASEKEMRRKHTKTDQKKVVTKFK